jgi:diguanylate cyclase (GGDEF)-like protein
MSGASARNDLTGPPDDGRSSPAEGDLRVILVGRTGLDQALRRDRGVEIIRARTPMDAIGELSDPIDAASPTRTVVVVASDAEPEESELAGFVQGLRIVDPRVRVARVGARGAPPYDAGVHEGADANDLRLLFDAALGGAPTPDSPVQEDDDALTPSEPTPAPGGMGPTDLPALETITRGRDPVGVCVELIRTRMGRPDVRFVPSEESDARPGDPRAGCAPVRLGDSVVGLLVLEGPAPSEAEREALESHAAWLSAWIRLGEQQRALRLAAFTDTLTGAWNRRYYERFTDAAIEQARNARQTLTVLFFDIDEFKTYNDRYGYEAGDEILVETVRMMQSVIRPSDRVCRIGGDEFAVVFHEPQGPRHADSQPPESIFDIATRFQRQICEHRFPKLGADAQGTLTISGGLATYPWDGVDAVSLRRRAAELARESKRQGKNVITLGPGAERVCARPPKD